MAAPAYVQKQQTGAYSTGGSATAALPSFTVGNLLVILGGCVAGSGVAGVTAPSPAWTSLFSYAFGFGGTIARAFCFYRIAQTGDTGPLLSTSPPAGTTDWTIWVAEYSGVNGATPVDGANTGGAIASSSNPAAPAFTTTVTDDLLVSFLAQGLPGSLPTAPTGETLNANINDPNSSLALGLSSKAVASPSTVGSSNWTAGTSNGTQVSVRFALEATAIDTLAVPFISSATTVYAPTLTGSGSATLTAPNIAATTTLFTQSVAYAIPADLIAATGAVYDPTLVVSGTAALTVPNIPSTTAVYTPSLALFGTPFIPATTVVYAPTIRRSGIGVQPVGVSVGFADDVAENAPTWERLDA